MQHLSLVTPPAPATSPLPFAIGDAVVFDPRPCGAETVIEIDHSKFGWQELYLHTRFEPAPLVAATRWAPAREFRLIAPPDRWAGPAPLTWQPCAVVTLATLLWLAIAGITFLAGRAF